jgi:putative chitinase
MILTDYQLDCCVPLATDRAIAQYLPFLNKYFQTYEINTKKRISAFLAQIVHESGSFRYCEEIASGSNYEYREDLGNLEFEALQAAHTKGTTTGKFYKGRGLLQITGYYNYKDCGKALGIDLVHSPKLLLLPEYAVQSAMWFWQTHKCNELADKWNFRRITKIINGQEDGKYTHLKERIAIWEHIKEILV